MTLSFMYNFRISPWEIPYDFLKFNFPHLAPHVRLFFEVKRKPEIFGFKNVMERMNPSSSRMNEQI